MNMKIVLIFALLISFLLSGCGSSNVKRTDNLQITSSNLLSPTKSLPDTYINPTTVTTTKGTEQQTNGSSTKSNIISNMHYTNARFGFSIDYPLTFSLQDSPPTNGDGIKVYTPDKSARITVYGSNIVLDWDVNYFYKSAIEEHKDATYKIQEGNWYVVSWVDGNNIGYKKGVVGKGSMNAFEIIYPKNENQAYDPVIDKLSSSFKNPGIDEGHGMEAYGTGDIYSATGSSQDDAIHK